MTPSGIEQTTFRFVAQHLNHCATAVPNQVEKHYKSKDRGSHFFMDLALSDISLLVTLRGKYRALEKMFLITCYI